MPTDGDRIVIIGGGPAGCAAAITCARAGRQVVILDAARAPRERPGETLHPGIEPLFDRLGVGDAIRAGGFIRHEGIRVAWDRAERTDGYGRDAAGPWRGFQIRRATLDAILREQAARLGVEIRAGVRVLAPIVAGARRIAGVHTVGGALGAAWTIDAAGGGHWLARRSGLAVQCLTPRLLARHGYVRRPRGELPLLRATTAGWSWTAEVAPGRYQWTQLPFDEGAAALPPVGGTPVGKTRTADVTWRWVPASAGAGYFITGDAAAVLDPTSSHGVLRALMCGMLAGHLIAATPTAADAGDAADAVEAAAAEYRARLRAWLSHDIAALARLYAALSFAPRWAQQLVRLPTHA